MAEAGVDVIEDVIAEKADGNFPLTEMGALLRADVPARRGAP